MGHVLTIPDQKVAAGAVKDSGGTCGQGDLVAYLSRLPLARSEREVGKPWKHMDHIHLGLFNGTDYCQWWGRAGNGYHYPIGRIMQIVEKQEG